MGPSTSSTALAAVGMLATALRHQPMVGPVRSEEVMQEGAWLEDRCGQTSTACKESLRAVSDRLQVISESLEEFRIGRNSLDQQTSRQAHALEDSIALDFSASRRARQDSAAK